MSAVLASIINKIFTAGVFPSNLKRGKIVPVFKKGNRNFLANYRPITILPFFSKLIEKLISDRLMAYFAKFNLLTNCQFGFRPNLSTEVALIEFTDKIKQLIDKGQWAGAVFIDFTKAFDTINHKILFSKLESLGICGPPLTLLRSYLADRTQVVRLLDATSQTITVNQGVPQGSILGPLLFLVYINDLPTCLNNTTCILYADDTTILTGDPSLDALTARLNKNLENIATWCNRNALQINPTKTKYLLFHTSNKHPASVPSLCFERNVIPVSRTVTFLGVLLDTHLKFNLHVKSLTKKIGFGLRVLIRSRSYFQQHILISLYYAFVHSHLNYCLSSWGNTYSTHLSCLDHLQNQAVRLITFSPYNASALPIYTRLKIPPLKLAFQLKLGAIIFRARTHGTFISSFFDSQLTNTNPTRFAQGLNLLLPKAYTNYGKQTAIFAAIKLWNSLPITIKLSYSMRSFNSSLRSFLLTNLSE